MRIENMKGNDHEQKEKKIEEAKAPTKATRFTEKDSTFTESNRAIRSDGERHAVGAYSSLSKGVAAY